MDVKQCGFYFASCWLLWDLGIPAHVISFLFLLHRDLWVCDFSVLLYCVIGNFSSYFAPSCRPDLCCACG